MFNLNEFISNNVTKRSVSMFDADISDNKERLCEEIYNKSVLIIGGAGSIGSSFVKEILRYEPKAIVVVDNNENGLTELTRDLRASEDLSIPADYVTYPMDYSSNTFHKMFERRRGFDVVANFSAHKHVRSEKDIISVEAMLTNNIINASKLMDTLCKYKPEKYFCVSTDKAANPANIMGASKRLMEDMIFTYSDRFNVSTARFANVAFSNGSLLDGFLERIKKMQPLSGPNDIKRYFVSPRESGQICLIACFLADNREILYPKLEESQMMSFDSIGKELVKSFGYNVKECSSEEEAIEVAKELRAGSNYYPVFFSKSDTSGEKEYEEFATEYEKTDNDRFRSLGVIVEKPIPTLGNVNGVVETLIEAFKLEKTTKEDIVEIIKENVPGFNHIEKDKSLDQKM